MKQILKLYFVILSRCHSSKRTSTRTQETFKVEATLSAPVSLSLARRQYRARTPTVRRWRTQSRKGLCYSGPTIPNWLPDGAKHSRLRPRLARKTYWTDSRTKHQMANSWSIWSTAQSVHQQTHMTSSISRVDREPLVRFHWRSLSSINTPNLISTCFFLMIAVKLL